MRVADTARGCQSLGDPPKFKWLRSDRSRREPVSSAVGVDASFFDPPSELHEYTGRGPRKAQTLINDDVVTLLLADTLTKGERRLVDAGYSDRVLQLRHDNQLTMRDELIACVEGQLDRKVIAFMSQNHIDPDLAVEGFVLGPDGAD